MLKDVQKTIDDALKMMLEIERFKKKKFKNFFKIFKNIFKTIQRIKCDHIKQIDGK